MQNKMKLFNSPHKRKSFIITILLVALLFLFFSLMGLSYIDPPIEYGMEVSIGNNFNGKGEIKLNKSLTVDEKQEKKLDESKTKSKPIDNINSKTKKVITQENTNSTIVKNNSKDSLNFADKKDSNTKIVESEQKKQKIQESTKSILSNLINSENNNQVDQGVGDSETNDEQGKSNGNPYSTIYYGQKGRGGEGVGYGLNGRSLQVNGKQTQNCNEAGTVVVRIEVNPKGDVISAKPGVKGTTNNHPCLLEPAEITARMHKWFPDNNAPARQIGFVVIEFKLVE
tara:strand:- start:14023 stop:14874 length:852 start_codon:yes stop_codon:yes gene_type:complete